MSGGRLGLGVGGVVQCGLMAILSHVSVDR